MFTFKQDIHPVSASYLKKTIEENVNLSTSYFALLFFSNLIATLGLIINSSPIIIGAMLIAPLMWPILGVAVSISINNKNLFKKTIVILAISIVASFFFSFIIALLSPFHELNTEILNRTQPNFLDLIIALGSGAIAILALIQPKIMGAAVGVAIAASLMPPLCVGGIGLAFNEMHVMTGGLLLFFANLFAIIFISITVLFFVEVKSWVKTKELQKKGFLVTSVFMGIMAVVLWVFLQNVIAEHDLQREVQVIIEKNIQTVSSDIELRDVSMIVEKINNKEIVNISAEILIPESVNLTHNIKTNIADEILSRTKKTAELSFRIVPTVNLVVETDDGQKLIKDEIQIELRKQFDEISSDIEIAALDISIIEEQIEEDSQVILETAESSKKPEIISILVNATIEIPSQLQLTIKEQNTISKAIEDVTQIKTDLVLKMTPIYRAVEENIFEKNLKETVEKYFSKISKQIEVKEVSYTESVDEDYVDVSVLIYTSSEFVTSISKKDFAMILSNKLSVFVNADIRIIQFEVLGDDNT